MLNHALFLSSSAACPGGAGGGEPLSSLCRCQGAWCVSVGSAPACQPWHTARGARGCLPAAGSTWAPADPPPQHTSLCPPALPSPRRPLLSDLPQEHLPRRPACSAPARPSWGLSYSPTQHYPPPQDTITWLLGALCQAHAWLSCTPPPVPPPHAAPRGASSHGQSDGGWHVARGLLTACGRMGLWAEGPASSSPPPSSHLPHRKAFFPPS